MISRISTALILALWANTAAALSCENIEFEGASYAICRVDVAADQPRLFLNKSDGTPYGHFSALPGKPRFAMNAGMYHADRSPVGHYIEDGQETMRVIPNAGPGNFGLLPNGILCINPDAALVIETLRYVDEPPSCAFATQSGPMLVIDGALHPRFLPDSTSRHIRNGVGSSADGGELIFAISNRRVTFHEFGRLFREFLGVDQALYLDGSISRLYAPEIGRNDFGVQLGPIVAVID